MASIFSVSAEELLLELSMNTKYQVGQEIYVLEAEYRWITIPCPECAGSKTMISKKTGKEYKCGACVEMCGSVDYRSNGYLSIRNTDYSYYRSFGPFKIQYIKREIMDDDSIVNSYCYETAKYHDDYDSVVQENEIYLTKEYADIEAKAKNSFEISKLGARI